ncbi:MAG: dipeptide epimerase [Bacteroidales bacterium]|nr:dipeptide epimerase [Bacteroidales bacterium]
MCRNEKNVIKKSRSVKSTLNMKFKPYLLHLKHSFNLAISSRTTTPVMLTEIEYDGITGYGEASMPPYLGESHETVSRFLFSLDLNQFNDPFILEDILDYVENFMPGNYAAKASVDIALHDLIGKLSEEPVYRLLGLNPEMTPFTSFTIGIDTPEIVREKVEEAAPYKILKVKLGKDNDREMIEVIRSVTDKPLCADVNQGWKDREYALEMAHWLKEKGIIFLEQPMPKEQFEDILWLKERSPLPIIGDEAIQNLADLIKYKDIYSGVNVKLMKCGGIRSAFVMLKTAKALGMKTMIGCMTETSCAVTAAAHLSPLADWCDLDGNLLISNDPFEGLKITDGKVTLPVSKPGIGVEKIKNL